MTVSHHGAEVTTVPLQMLGSTVMQRNKQKSAEPVIAQVMILITLLLAGGEAWYSHWDSSLYSFLAPSCSWSCGVLDSRVVKGKQSSRGTTFMSPTSNWDGTCQ